MTTTSEEELFQELLKRNKYNQLAIRTFAKHFKKHFSKPSPYILSIPTIPNNMTDACYAPPKKSLEMNSSMDLKPVETSLRDLSVTTHRYRVLK